VESWVVATGLIALYLAVTLGIGLVANRRGTGEVEDFFLYGRKAGFVMLYLAYELFGGPGQLWREVATQRPDLLSLSLPGPRGFFTPGMWFGMTLTLSFGIVFQRHIVIRYYSAARGTRGHRGLTDRTGATLRLMLHPQWPRLRDGAIAGFAPVALRIYRSER
jgi:Na+/proline symporter